MSTRRPSANFEAFSTTEVDKASKFGGGRGGGVGDREGEVGCGRGLACDRAVVGDVDAGDAGLRVGGGHGPAVGAVDELADVGAVDRLLLDEGVGHELEA